MLVIRRDQMRVFEQVLTEQFVERTADDLARRHPQRVAELGKEATRTLVRDGVARARTYGIRETDSVRAFVELMLKVHPEFETLPHLEGVREVLADDELSGEAKMSIVSDQMRSAFPDA